MDADEKLVAVYTASTPGQADVAKMALEEAGIPAAVTNDSLHGIHGFATVGAHALPSVFVAERDVEAAQAILAELTTDSGFLSWSKKSDSEMRATDDSSMSRAIEPWPLCPQCHKARVTICPVCSTSGSDFPRAHENFNQDEATQVVDLENAEEDAPPHEQRLAVICSTCDEPWLARFLRRCEWCGHDFGVGLKVDYVPAEREPNESLNPRALFLALLMAGVLGGVFAWFWMVGRH